ncbi:glycosyltransferase [Cryobacterium tepidiphilum]|uniref:glycosyltransferase n=1 Tax=Cryobacterium tepidiphilum TaxID=2486026 RepID=UPI0011CDA49F|nr:glycosyltransferase [Cryobacterium tepidiphilum]
MRHLALEWWIPDDFGGMTTALLRRSRAFVTLGGATVDVLTLDPGRDYGVIVERLRERGGVIPGIRILNLWDDLAARHDLPGSPAEQAADDDGPVAGDELVPQLVAGAVRTLTRFASDCRTVLQVDHLRPDGSLLVRDRRDTAARGTLGGRRVTLFDHDGHPVMSWKKIWSLYAYWLDLLVGDEPAIAVIDSKVTARFAATYRRPNVATVHVIHSSHLAGTERPYGPLLHHRENTVRRLHDFDAVVVLTDRQRDDLQTLLGPAPNLATIPNSIALAEAPADSAPRAATAGIMLASLEEMKRIEHAIRAVAAASRQTPGLSLRIFGHGPRRALLQAEIDACGAAGSIELSGYDPHARDRFAEASFTLLTSEFEGFGLVLVEAMAAGCIPIAYDVPYGPADIIEHGVNGFLVPAGDEAALADAIARFVETDAETVAAMRARAIETARRYSDARVTGLWAALETHVLEGKMVRPVAFGLAGVQRTVVPRRGGLRVTMTFEVQRSTVAPSAVSIAVGRAQPPMEVRQPASFHRRLLKRDFEARVDFTPEQVGWMGDPATLDVALTVTIGGTTKRAEISAP